MENGGVQLFNWQLINSTDWYYLVSVWVSGPFRNELVIPKMLECTVGVKDDPQASLASRWLQRATGYCDQWKYCGEQGFSWLLRTRVPMCTRNGWQVCWNCDALQPRQVWGAPESPHPPDLWPPTGHSSCPTELLPPARCRASVLYVHQANDTIGKFCPRQDSHHHIPAQFSLTMLLSLGLKSLGFQVIINPNPSLLPAFLFPVIEMDRNFGDCFLLFL